MIPIEHHPYLLKRDLQKLKAYWELFTNSLQLDRPSLECFEIVERELTSLLLNAGWMIDHIFGEQPSLKHMKDIGEHWSYINQKLQKSDELFQSLHDGFFEDIIHSISVLFTESVDSTERFEL